MTSRAECEKAQGLAGAIAIGEADEGERVLYRAHLAGCRRCLDHFGGEHEIERVIGSVARARNDERWEPDVRGRLRRAQRPARVWFWGPALVAIAAIVIGVRTSERVPSTAPTHRVSAQEVRALAALNTQSVPLREGRADSLAVGVTTLSSAFAVTLDARGVPLKCAITKTSGVRSLDDSVCRAAMRAQYRKNALKSR